MIRSAARLGCQLLRGLSSIKTVDVDTFEYLWDLAGPLPMLLSDGERDYLYGPDLRPLAHVDSEDEVTWYSHDQIGSTRLLTDDTGQQVATYRYTPHGAELDHTGTATTPLRFAGEYTDDETGYQYLRARYYDPTTGQFLTRDPIEGLSGEPYGYAWGNPLDFTDPSGELPVLAAVGIGLVVGAGIELGVQTLGNRFRGCSPLDDINWRNVALWGAVGGLTSGIGHLAKATKLARTPSAARSLDDASRAAFRAADDIGDFAVKAKHLPESSGSWNKFAQGVDPRSAVQDALRSGKAQFLPNPNLPNTFRVVADVGYTVGSKGETALRVIVSNDGRVINAFPVKVR